MAPSQLQIATGVLQRLVKEEASYHKELASQQARIDRLEKAQSEGNADAEGDGNEEYQLRQEVSFFSSSLGLLSEMGGLCVCETFGLKVDDVAR
jgi:hypothetical protein